MNTDRFYARFLRMNPLRFVGARFQQAGDHFETVRNGEITFATRSPEHVRQVLVEQAERFGRVPNPLEDLFQDGLIVSEGDLWKRRRKALQPAFRSVQVARTQARTRELTRELVNEWGRGEVDLVPRLRSTQLQLMFDTLFSIDAYQEDVVEALEIATVLSGAHRAGRQVTDDDDHLRSTAASHLQRITERILSSSPSGPVLGHLQQAVASKLLTETEAKTEIRSLLLAGHDTVVSAAAWAAYWLATVEGAGEFVRLGERHAKAAGREVLRLHPPAYAIPRVCLHRAQIGDVWVEQGTQVILWIYWVHRDARWYTDSNAFRVERFLDREPAGDGTYAPFGLGGHNCIGKHIAEQQITALIAAMGDFDLEWLEDRPPKAVPLMTLQPSTMFRMQLS